MSYGQHHWSCIDLQKVSLTRGSSQVPLVLLSGILLMTCEFCSSMITDPATHINMNVALLETFCHPAFLASWQSMYLVLQDFQTHISGYLLIRVCFYSSHSEPTLFSIWYCTALNLNQWKSLLQLFPRY